MKITEYDIRQLVARVLAEGYQADLEALKQKYPAQASILSSPPFTGPKGPKWTGWLSAKFLTGKGGDQNSMDHAVHSLKDLESAERQLTDWWRGQPDFMEMVNAALPPQNRSWRDPVDIATMTIGDIDTLLNLRERYAAKKRDRLGIDYETISVDGDRLGTVGPWTLWMPTTRENSCAIVRVKDPVTGQMVPSPCVWCTAKTEGSNLFYHYVARKYENIVLFYVIKQDPQGGDDFISIGFLDDEPYLGGKDDYITVNCANKGLTEPRLRKIFGSHYNTIMKILTNKSLKIGGQHPAKEKVAAATQSLEAFNYLIKGIGKNERIDMAKTVLEWDPDDINPQVEAKCLELMSDHRDESFRAEVAEHLNCPPHILIKLSEDTDGVKSSVASNANCPPHILEKLFYNDDPHINSNALENPNCPPEIKNNWEMLSNHKNPWIKDLVAENPNCPPHILEKLFNGDDQAAYSALHNPNFPPEIKNDLELLSNHKNSNVLGWVARNPNCPLYILEKLFNYNNDYVSYYALTNPNFPPKIKNDLELLSNHKNNMIRTWVAKNLKCPPEILKKLSRDPEPEVSRAALKAIKNRGIQLESLRRKIKILLRETL